MKTKSINTTGTTIVAQGDRAVKRSHPRHETKPRVMYRMVNQAVSSAELFWIREQAKNLIETEAVLVIPLTPESIEALRKKVQRALNASSDWVSDASVVLSALLLTGPEEASQRKRRKMP